MIRSAFPPRPCPRIAEAVCRLQIFEHSGVGASGFAFLDRPGRRVRHLVMGGDVDDAFRAALKATIRGARLEMSVEGGTRP
jgi:hypothetical protein